MGLSVCFSTGVTVTCHKALPDCMATTKGGGSNSKVGDSSQHACLFDYKLLSLVQTSAEWEKVVNQMKK